jgi:hypothetical protein
VEIGGKAVLGQELTEAAQAREHIAALNQAGKRQAGDVGQARVGAIGWFGGWRLR